MFGVEEYFAGCGCLTMIVGLLLLGAVMGGDWGTAGTLFLVFIFLLVIVIVMSNCMKEM